jgi:tetratricopeptide (TPR) repeat protein
MDLDVYSPCPCGSGKKLKFCCAAIVDDMAKVARFQAGEQPRQALQIIEKLEKSHPENPWVVTTHAEILMGLREMREAKERLGRLLTSHPDYPPAFSALAMASLFEDGYDAARPAIYRAFQKCIARSPRSAGMVAFTVGAMMKGAQRSMAARQYLTLAMQTLGQEAREDVFVMLVRLDGDVRVPYPLRNIHNLNPYAGTGEMATEAAKANALVNIGCWGPAARCFLRIAEHTREGTEVSAHNADLWQNIGLCRAWDGDEAAAAAAFHEAARQSSDFERAVECETLAQLLDLRTTANVALSVEACYSIRSASQLLGLLDGNDRIVPSPDREEPDDDEAPPAGAFLILDRSSLPTDIDWNRATSDEVPHIAALLTIYDADPAENREATAVISGYSNERFDSARALFEALLGDQAIAAPVVNEEADPRRLPCEHIPYLSPFKLPDDISAAAASAIMATHWRRVIREIWPNAPQAALDNKSPLEVKDDGQYKVRLTAAVYVFDAILQTMGANLDLEEQLKLVGLDAPQPIPLTANLSLNALSPMQLHRLPVSQLSDAQLIYAHRRAMLIGHRRFVERILKEVLSRPACVDQVDLNHVYRTLVNVVRDDGRIDEALTWVKAAKEHTPKERPFEWLLSWTLTEFFLRAERVDDPELPGIYRTLSEYYAPKVPEVGAIMENFRQTNADKHPWLQGSQFLVGSGAPGGPDAGGGLWTPSSTSRPAGSGKLWLPGQE